MDQRLERLRERAEALARSVTHDPAQAQAAESPSLQETLHLLAARTSDLLKLSESRERGLGEP